MKKLFKNKYIANLCTFIISMYVSILSFSINVNAQGVPAQTKENFMKSLQPFFKEYGLILNTFVGIVVLTNFIIFMYHFCRLAKMSCDHPLIRKEAINNIMISGVCLALIGGAGTIYAILFTVIMK